MLTAKDIDIVAKTLWGEARGEGEQGMRAVAWVIRNRAMDDRWPDAPLKVCLQPWQFSCWNKEDPNLSKLRQLDFSDPNYARAYAVAADVLTTSTQCDPTKGANHYLARWLHNSSPPRWVRSGEKTDTIGEHVFFKL